MVLPRDLKILPRSTRFNIPSSCPHARLLWRVLPVAVAGSWGRLFVQHSLSRAAVRGSCSRGLALAHPLSAACWGASGADSPAGVPPATAVGTKVSWCWTVFVRHLEGRPSWQPVRLALAVRLTWKVLSVQLAALRYAARQGSWGRWQQSASPPHLSIRTEHLP